MTEKNKFTVMRQRINEEIFFALGMKRTGFISKTFGWVFNPPSDRFARIFTPVDDAVGEAGLGSGCRLALPRFINQLSVTGAGNLPQTGPSLIVGNHPGAADTLAICAQSHRKDLKIIVKESPFYHAMPNTNNCFIPVPYDDTNGSMIALRNAIKHLQQGGALLLFGAGSIQVDPAVYPQQAFDELDAWSASIEIMLRKVPETNLSLAMTSGVVLKRFAHSLVARMRRKPLDQRRLAEFYQIICQMLSPKAVKVDAHLTISEMLGVEDLWRANKHLMVAIRQAARQLLADHLATWGIRQEENAPA